MIDRRERVEGYRRIVLSLVLLVIVPTSLLLTVGVLLLFLGDPTANLLMGILVLALSGAVVTGVILVWVFVRRQASVSALQNDFVSKVSHELRTPLTSIRLFTETLAMRRGDLDTERRCLEGLARESTRLQELIDRLLDWGRMESGRRQYEMTACDAREVVRGALKAFDSVRERRTIELSVELGDAPLPVNVDRGAMADALLNLLTNAAKYGGDPGQVCVHAGVRGGMVRLSVTDNGAGIPRPEHQRIFQKFYRSDDRLSRECEGSGLGLAIVRHVVKAHSGRVELDSSPGRGSTFAILLPPTEQPLAATPIPPTAAVPSVAASVSPGG
ncbi:MAG: HAMP domain-containing histidine kinase [Polyangiaceae bacterium]|nr:HAMP domain-containing histidine kinase [Polyangiaceae bacterium]